MEAEQVGFCVFAHNLHPDATMVVHTKLIKGNPQRILKQSLLLWWHWCSPSATHVFPFFPSHYVPLHSCILFIFFMPNFWYNCMWPNKYLQVHKINRKKRESHCSSEFFSFDFWLWRRNGKKNFSPVTKSKLIKLFVVCHHQSLQFTNLFHNFSLYSRIVVALCTHNIHNVRILQKANGRKYAFVCNNKVHHTNFSLLISNFQYKVPLLWITFSFLSCFWTFRVFSFLPCFFFHLTINLIVCRNFSFYVWYSISCWIHFNFAFLFHQMASEISFFAGPFMPIPIYATILRKQLTSVCKCVSMLLYSMWISYRVFSIWNAQFWLCNFLIYWRKKKVTKISWNKAKYCYHEERKKTNPVWL